LETSKSSQDTSIVAFTGKPDPDDVVNGHWPVKKSQFYKKIYKQLKTPKWISENWL
jgi:NADH:ubiquinone oxidoreductase subunit B-like Fe-S oxidoreductase